MYFICKCLNVSIKTKGNEFKNVNLDDIELNVKEQAEAFFNNNIAALEYLDYIKKEQPGLVEVKNIGAWAVYRCYNCLIYTHAIRRDYRPDLFLVNTNIITSEEQVNNLKSSNNYSPIFRIVIDSTKIQELDPLEPQRKFSVSHLPNSSRLALASLEQQLEKAIHQQAQLIDIRIREFTREQYEILDKFSERAHSEHTFLARLICNEQSTVNVSNHVDDLPATLQTIQPNKTTSMNDTVNTTANSISNITLCQHSSNNSHNTVHVNGSSNSDSKMKDTNIDDGEPFFLLEGIDDGPSMNRYTQISDQESDTDDSGNEATHIPHNHRGGHPTMARSLPVNVPAFHSFNQRSIRDDDDEQISRDPMDPHNIQASIKALARSVHGDTVFGDLPRPRFSTQL